MAEEGFYVYARFRETGADKVISKLKQVNDLVTKINHRKIKIHVDDKSIDNIAEKIQRKLDTYKFTININGVNMSKSTVTGSAGSGGSGRAKGSGSTAIVPKKPQTGWTRRPKYEDWVFYEQFLGSPTSIARYKGGNPLGRYSGVFSGSTDDDIEDAIFRDFVERTSGGLDGIPATENGLGLGGGKSGKSSKKSDSDDDILSKSRKLLSLAVVFRTLNKLNDTLQTLAKYSSQIELGATALTTSSESISQLAGMGVTLASIQGLQSSITGGLFGNFNSELARFMSYLGISYTEAQSQGAEWVYRQAVERAIAKTDRSDADSVQKNRYIVEQIAGSEGTKLYDRFLALGVSTFDEYEKAVGGQVELTTEVADGWTNLWATLETFKNNFNPFLASLADNVGITDGLAGTFKNLNLGMAEFSTALSEGDSIFSAFRSAMKAMADTSETENVKKMADVLFDTTNNPDGNGVMIVGGKVVQVPGWAGKILGAYQRKQWQEAYSKGWLNDESTAYLASKGVTTLATAEQEKHWAEEWSKYVDYLIAHGGKGWAGDIEGYQKAYAQFIASSSIPLPSSVEVNIYGDADADDVRYGVQKAYAEYKNSQLERQTATFGGIY